MAVHLEPMMDLMKAGWKVCLLVVRTAKRMADCLEKKKGG